MIDLIIRGRKQEGISFLLTEMKTLGGTVKPIMTLGGRREVNEVPTNALIFRCSSVKATFDLVILIVR
ncbi:MAG: hypothetical protein HRU24_00410 [Gammaproteobacteria bacterium]|nr:hypothetical protein [Gammaproteobacteria bacterium]